MEIGGPGVLGDNALVHVEEEFSLPIVTAITQLLETTGGTAQESELSIAPVMSCLVLPMVCFPKSKLIVPTIGTSWRSG